MRRHRGEDDRAGQGSGSLPRSERNRRRAIGRWLGPVQPARSSARHRRLQSISLDGISGWSEPEFVEDLPEPICFGSLARLSEQTGGGKNCLLFSIVSGTAIGRKKNNYDEQGFQREDLAVFLSYDEGRTWPVKKTIQAGPCGCGYSDLAVLADGTILCACGSGPSFGRGAGISLARFDLEWLTDGKESFHPHR